MKERISIMEDIEKITGQAFEEEKPPLRAFWPTNLPNGPFVIYEGPLTTNCKRGKTIREGRIVFDFNPFPVARCEFEMDFHEAFDFDPDLTHLLNELDFGSVSIEHDDENPKNYLDAGEPGPSRRVSRYFFDRGQCVGETEGLSEIRFQIINLSHNVGYEGVVEGNMWKAKRNRWKFDDWELVFDALLDATGLWSSVCRQRGYAFTHTGSLTKLDNREFNYGDAVEALEAVSLFLSFWGGQRVAFALPVGISTSGYPCLLDLSVSAVDPAIVCRNWFSVTQISNLEDLCCKFISLYQNSDWRSVLQVVVSQYTESLGSGRYIGAKMNSTCSGLETIVWQLLVQERELLTQEAYDKLDWHDCLRLILKYIQVQPNKVRSYGGDEVVWPEDAKDRDKSVSFLVRAANGNLKDGPEAIAWVRNRIVHPDKKGQLSFQIMLEAENLAKWYLELLLLFGLNYLGGHYDRILDKPSVMVPWAVSQHSEEAELGSEVVETDSSPDSS